MRRLCLVVVLGLITGSLTVLSTNTAAEPRINMQALMAKRVPVLLEFGRGWCIPCKYMKPILEDMARTYAGKAIVTTVDMDANKDLVRNFNIRMMPTQVFLTPDGKEFFRNEGTLEREQIAQVFAKMGVPAATPQTRVPAPEVSSRPTLPPVLPIQPDNVR
ncbi:MAG TPA: thioredoxin family protein [Desulfomonilaceae bacterium]|nr:thioredoxin family protein [Desulfomonilaceae bacterium]